MILLDGNTLTISDLAKVAREDEEVGIKPEALELAKRSREELETILNNDCQAYGIKTGFNEAFIINGAQKCSRSKIS